MPSLPPACRLLIVAAAILTLPPLARAASDTNPPALPTPSPTGAVGPESAPVTMVVFSDFACPYSSQLFFTLQKLETRYPTQLRVILKQSPLPIHPDAMVAHRAALAAGKQGKFVPMAELLYANQAHQDLDSLLNYARQLHLDIARFRQDLDSPATGHAVRSDLEESRAFGIDSTPTMFLNGRTFTGLQTEETLAAAIDRAALGAAGTAGKPLTGPLNPALDEALQRELQTHPTAARGNPTAPLVITEFTDFQCPFCRLAVQPMEQLLAARGREVRWEFRAFPLDFHPDAELAAEAALAAGAEGKFWPMHDLLFAHQSALKPADLRLYAQQLGLDLKAFDDALSTHRYAGAVAADRALGARAGVSGTPTFIIDGHLFTGALQLPELTQIADAHDRRPSSQSASALPLLAGPATPVSGAEHLVFGTAAPAPVNVTWFTDVRSPLAARQADLVQSLSRTYRSRLRVLYKAFPLPTHTDGRLASAALMAASGQGKFWEMFAALTQRHDLLDTPKLLDIARTLGLDPDAFRRAAEESLSAVDADVAEAVRRGIQGAPVVFLNAQRVDGLQREAFYTDLLDNELKNAPEQKATVALP